MISDGSIGVMRLPAPSASKSALEARRMPLLPGTPSSPPGPAVKIQTELVPNIYYSLSLIMTPNEI